MQIRIIAAVAAGVALTGCATFNQFTEKHPVATAVGMTVIAGSIVATAEANGHHGPSDFNANHGHKPCSNGGVC